MDYREREDMAGVVWTVVVILFVVWLLGYMVFRLGPAIHGLLVLAVIAIVYKLLVGRRAV
ncbi:MAG TPA: lmo0937 family membrane protein [Candidatus Limnocylindria bacterium]|nr:lmo0937 family membrane protein [Candidatus Limnocylindria bacterium]